MAKVGKKRSVVLDGEEQKQYENLGKAGICFSPDSRRLAYVAMVGKKKWAEFLAHRNRCARNSAQMKWTFWNS